MDTGSAIDYSPLGRLIDISELNRCIADGYVSVRPHPKDSRLKILNYTAKCQYSGMWSPVTKACRGLIIHLCGEDAIGDNAVVVARPWEKFFTLEQIESGWALKDEDEGKTVAGHHVSLTEPAEATDKIDGSMLVLYEWAGRVMFATRGSFDSAQAKAANEFLNKNISAAGMACLKGAIREGYTLIFEYVSPGNRIVISYGKEDVVFLGGVVTATGQYISPLSFPHIKEHFTVTEVFPAATLQEALELPPRENAEGIVVRSLTGNVQYKIKQEDYLRMYRQICKLTSRALYERWLMSAADPVAFQDFKISVMDILREADFDKVDEYLRSLDEEYSRLFKRSFYAHKEIVLSLESDSRKEYVEKAKTAAPDLFHVLMAIYDKDYSRAASVIAKMLKPESNWFIVCAAEEA